MNVEPSGRSDISISKERRTMEHDRAFLMGHTRAFCAHVGRRVQCARIGNEIKGGRAQMSADASTHFHLALARQK